ncbi:DUF4097 family beta strand repeat protein [bacterium]|nr:DUF4097 family beta strand repeat protein [bacterium]
MRKFNVMLILSLMWVGCVFAAEKTMSKEFQVKPGGTLYIDASYGTIQVVSQNDPAVKVEVTFKRKTGSQEKLQQMIDDLDLKFKTEGSDVYIVMESENDSFFSNFWKHMDVHFDVIVPTKYNVDLKTSGGSIAVGDLDGNAKSKTSGGSLKFGKITGSILGKTSGGSISLDECLGPVDVKTSGGSIKIGEVKGDVEAHTSGGSITVHEVMGTIDAGTSGGSVKATITSQPANECKLTTSGGSINVIVSEDIRLNIDAKTSGGRIYTDFPVTMMGHISDNTLNGEINGGGPLLFLRTSGGGISIKKSN